MMAALIAATAANPGFGSRAGFPEMNTTEPFEAFNASQGRTKVLEKRYFHIQLQQPIISDIEF
jgi:hypothetical protein